MTLNNSSASDWVSLTSFLRRQHCKTYNNYNNNLLLSSAQVSTIRFSNAHYKEQNNLNMSTI